MDLLAKIIKKVKKKPKKVIFPEGEDGRILKGAEMITRQRIAKVILLGNVKRILSKAKKLRLKLKDVEIINPSESKKLKFYAKKLYNLRKKKGLSFNQALDLVKRPIYFGTMLLKLEEADALISGAVHPTAHTLLPAFQIIKNKGKASGAMLMLINNKEYLFADCAVQADPSSKELAEIAINSAKTFESLIGKKPRVAMLSYSTKGSAKGLSVNKVRKAIKLVKKKNKKLIIDGELQLDAAIVPWIGKKKNPRGIIKGDANVLIFPNLDAGNIGYKLVERFCKAKAIGPIIQGLAKPVNDLSRGCSVEDVVNLTKISLMQIEK